MKKIKDLTETELRQIIKEEVKMALSEFDTENNPKTEGFIDSKEAAKILMVKMPTLYNMISQNKVPCHKNGKRVLFKRSELIGLLNASKGEK